MGSTSAGAEVTQALRAASDATKDKTADAAKQVKAKTVEAKDSIGDAVSAAFDSAGQRSWKIRRKTDRRSRVRARKRRRRAAQAEGRAEKARLKAAAALAPLTESVESLVAASKPPKKRTPLKTVTVVVLAGGATFAVIRQVLNRRQVDATATDDGAAAPAEGAAEQASSMASEAADEVADQAAATVDAAAEEAPEVAAAGTGKSRSASGKSTAPRRRSGTTTKARPAADSGDDAPAET